MRCPGPANLTGMSLALRAMHHPLLAPIYERVWRPALFFTAMGFDLEHYRHEKEHAVSSLRLSPGDRVLDLACGPGNFTAHLASVVGPHGKAIGLDLSQPMLRRALADNGADGASYVEASGHKLPFVDGSLDAVLCYGALYLIPLPFVVVDEMLRVVRPGGRVAIMASLAADREPFRSLERRAAAQTGLRVFDKDAFTTRLRRAGFTEISFEPHGALQYVAGTAPG
jgi:ubiquinone/menaquinone biosynthesis C-methylase UbiE